MIIKMRGQQPIKAFRNIYFKDIFLSGLFDSQKGKLPNPSPMFDLSEKADPNVANLLNDVLDAFFDENSVDEALSVVKVTELKPLDDQRKPSEEDLISAANSLAEFDSGLDEFSEYRDI